MFRPSGLLPVSDIQHGDDFEVSGINVKEMIMSAKVNKNSYIDGHSFA